MRKIIFIISLLNIFLFEQSSSACQVCFYGDPSQNTTMALKSAVFVLLGILICVMGLLVKFFISVAKKSKLTSSS